MEYSMGVIGIGHWFKRLQGGLESVGGIKVVKALGTKPYDSKAQVLEELGIDRDNYYTVGGDGTIPPAFFDGVDLIHISNPNEFHSSQIRQSLSKGKKAIVEKTYATNRKEFEEVKRYLKEGGFEDSIYLHLHYLHKLPTIQLRKSIKGLVAKHGRITGIAATFFEKVDEEDARRAKWLLDMKSGGLFMDWVHPFEVAYHATGASFGKMGRLNLYAVNESYDGANPSGVLAEVALKGKRFAEGAKMNVCIAKGTDPKYARKSMLFTFESGAYVRLGYLGSESESKENRGDFEVGTLSGGSRRVDSATTLPGKSSSEMFVKEILKLCKGKRAALKLSQISKVFRPQWEYQKLSKKQKLIRDPREVEMFLQDGLREA
jgi:predicted dehydrogenase